MRHKNWVTSLKLEQWADSLPARALLPQLLRRLIHATLDSSAVQRAEFPSGEGVQRHGIDGVTETTTSNAKVPSGKAAWEFGCDKDIKGKADGDFSKRPPTSNQRSPSSRQGSGRRRKNGATRNEISARGAMFAPTIPPTWRNGWNSPQPWTFGSPMKLD